MVLEARRFRWFCLAILALGIAECLVPSLCGQLAAAGTIAGTVTDPRGKVVAGARVVIKNTDLNWKRVLATDERGGFTAAALSTGAYTVEADAQGLKLKAPARVTLGVGSTIRLDLRLKVAVVSQKVTVT